MIDYPKYIIICLYIYCYWASLLYCHFYIYWNQFFSFSIDIRLSTITIEWYDFFVFVLYLKLFKAVNNNIYIYITNIDNLDIFSPMNMMAIYIFRKKISTTMNGNLFTAFPYQALLEKNERKNSDLRKYS